MLIVVQERVPVAVIEIAGRLRGLDSQGVVFNEYDKAPPGLPRISSTSSTTPDALKEAATVVAALPEELSAMVDHVEVLTVDQITLVLRDERVVLWGSSDDSATKAEVLLQLAPPARQGLRRLRPRPAHHLPRSRRGSLPPPAVTGSCA